MPAVANVGTSFNTPPIALINTFNAINAKMPADEIADQILKPSPTLWSLIRRGKKHDVAELVYPLFTAEDTAHGTYWGSQILDTTVIDNLQPANQVWSPYYQACSINQLDIKLNSGPGAVLDIVKSKLKSCFGSMLQMLARAAWGISPQNGALDVDNIDAWSRLTTNTIAGINRTTNTFWRPNANIATAAAGDFTESDAEKMYLAVTQGYDEPDLAVMSHTVFRAFKLHFTANIRYEKPLQDEEAIVAGFKTHFMYNNAIVMPERYLEDFASGPASVAPNNTIYWLNTKYIYPVFHPNDYFSLSPWLVPSNQAIITSRITVLIQIKSNNPRMLVAGTGF